jgi:hypothetical protein
LLVLRNFDAKSLEVSDYIRIFAPKSRKMETTKGVYTYEYPRPSVTTDCVIFGYDVKEGLSVLLIERGIEPYKGHWAFPGGF